jgi:Tfp pilus assembly protein PilN
VERILRKIEKFCGTFGFSAEDLDFLQKIGNFCRLQGSNVRTRRTWLRTDRLLKHNLLISCQLSVKTENPTDPLNLWLFFRLFESHPRLKHLMRLIPQTTVGIEIAGQDLRIAVLRDFSGKRRLLYKEVLAGFLGLPEQDRGPALLAVFKKNKITGLNIHLSFPGNCGIVRDLEFPAGQALEANLRAAVTLQIESLSPWPLDEIYWDCAWEAEKGARSIVVHVGIVPRQVVDPWIGLFRSLGLALTGASLSSLSWAHGAITFWGTARPAMIVAAENEYVEGTLIRDGRIHAAVMEGSNSAELMPGCASQLMRSARLDSPDQLRVIVHGAAAPGTEKESSQLPVGATASDDAFGPVSTALLGLARSGFRLNLIPGPLRFQRNRLQVVPAYSLAALLLLLGLFAWLREPYQESLYAQQLDRESRRVAVEVRPVAQQEKQLNRSSDRLKTLNALISARDSNLEALRELSRLLPPGTFLSSYSYQDRIVTITGLSESASAIQKLMEDSHVFHDAQFTSSITRDSSGKDRFSIRASVEVRQ